MAEKTEVEKYEQFIKDNSYIPDISWAAMARIDTNKYKQAVTAIESFRESDNG